VLPCLPNSVTLSAAIVSKDSGFCSEQSELISCFSRMEAALKLQFLQLQWPYTLRVCQEQSPYGMSALAQISGGH